MKQKTKNVLLWVLSIFCLLAVFVYIPSFASVIFLVVGVGSMPIEPIRKLWDKLPIAQKTIKTIVITVLFFVGCSVAPVSETTEVAQVEETAEISTETIEFESLDSVEESEVVETVIEETKEEIETVTETTEEATEENKQPGVSPEQVAVVEEFDIKSIPAYSGDAYVAVNENVPYFTDEEMSEMSYEYYSALDSKERCGVCVASVGIDIMPTEERGEIGNVKPSGWNQTKYAGLVEGNYLYNRCHLIGYQLTGENANTKNLITGTRYLNTEGMLPFENMVADYVKETNNHVMYRITPVFEGNNLLASGVLMEAKSVEDNGEGILFCVYCYNVQPGVTIDYSNGASALIETASSVTQKADNTKAATDVKATPNADTSSNTNVAPAASETVTPEPVAAPVSEEPAPQQTAGGSYAVNGNNGKIHIVGGCSATGSGDNAMNNPVYFNTYEEAEAYSIQYHPGQKKRPCGNCW